MTEVGNIVTLEGNQEYLILEETKKNGVRYLYAVRVLLDETPTDEYLIFENIVKDGGEYLLPVSDKALYDELIEDFKDIVADKVLGIEPDKDEN
jgi:hypothetical protein